MKHSRREVGAPAGDVFTLRSGRHVPPSSTQASSMVRSEFSGAAPVAKNTKKSCRGERRFVSRQS